MWIGDENNPLTLLRDRHPVRRWITIIGVSEATALTLTPGRTLEGGWPLPKPKRRCCSARQIHLPTRC
ncbi:hypothetical protein [Escherichia coli]|uniref:hypothetical protein n=1 Tax=Escherichia coli TaxID=562 RepID=UPI00388E78EF